MVLTRRSILTASLVGLVMPLPPIGRARAEEDIKAFILSLVDRAIKDLTGPELSLKERSSRLKQILSEYFDMEAVSKFVLGVYWRQASEQERKEFTRVFTDYMSVAYGKRFGEYTGQKILVENIRKDSPEMTTVFTVVDSESAETKPRIDWIIRTNSAPRIIDLRIEGLSLTATHRDEFAAVMTKSGGVPGLIKTLQNKITSTLQAQQ